MATPQSDSYRADVQGMRGIAVLVVVLYHAELSLFSGGFVGVDIFFVISGFVIGRVLLKELSSHGRLDLKRFYLRRARRLMPALAVTLGVVSLLSVLLLSPLSQQRAARTAASAALFTANLYLGFFDSADGYFATDATLNPFLHTWSLSVEEQFYFLVPLIVALAWRYGARSGRRPLDVSIAAVAALFIASFAGSVLMTSSASDDTLRLAFYLSPVRAWEFMAGILLAMTQLRSRWRAQAPLATIGLVAIAFSVFLYDPQTTFPGLTALVPVLGTVLVLAAPASSGSLVDRVLSIRPLVWLGDLSYSFYLWHWPLVVFAKVLWPTVSWAPIAAVTISLLPSIASLRLVENPIRRRQRSAWHTLRLAGICLLIPLASVGVLEVGYRALIRSDPVQLLADAADLPVSYDFGCDGTAFADLPTACTFNGETPHGRAILIGDSNAAHFADAAIGAANETGISLTVNTRAACPFALVSLYQEGELRKECRTWVESALSALEREPFDVVLIASASDLRIQSGEAIADYGGSAIEFEPEKKALLYESGLREVLVRLSAAGSRVVVINPVPRPDVLGQWSLEECPTVKILLGGSTCAVSFAEDWEAQRSRTVLAEQAAVAGVLHATTYDPAGALCHPTCELHRDGLWLWRDSTHVGPDASQILQSELVELLN